MLRLPYRPALARETWTDSEGRRCDLEYRRSGGRHVVVFDRPGQVFPGRAAFGTVEEARVFWAKMRGEYRAAGYGRVKV